MATLFLVASDDLRRSPLFRSEEVSWNFIERASNDREFVSSKEIAWTDEGGLAQYLRKRVRGSDLERIRVAGHMRPCFGTASSDSWQTRLSDLELQWKQEHLDDIDIQVYGFHHDIGSTIWRCLSRHLLATPRETKAVLDEEFFSHLEDAFESLPPFERLSLERHNILHLFLPIRLNLGLASELAASGKKIGAEQLVHDSLTSFNQKLELSKKIFATQIKPIADEFRRSKRLSLETSMNECEGILTTLPYFNANDFEKWFQSLDDILNKIKSQLS